MDGFMFLGGHSVRCLKNDGPLTNAPTPNQSSAITSLAKVFRESKFRQTLYSLIPDLFNNMIWGTSIQVSFGPSRGLRAQALYLVVIVVCLGFVSNLLVLLRGRS